MNTIDQPEKLDRRQQRTRRLLKEALISLIVERGYDDLTIQDITDRADLRRATFYLHYTTKEELLAQILHEMFDALVAEIGPTITAGDPLGGKTRLEPFLAMFEHVALHRELYRALLLGAAGTGITRLMRDYLAGLIVRALEASPAGTVSTSPAALAHYLAGAELGLVTWWLESNSGMPPAELARLAHRLVLDGARGVMPTLSSGD
jgi:AcrR family transcriptional regulator